MFNAFLFLAAAVSSSQAQPVPIDPSKWFSSDDYPFEASFEGVEGSVEYELDVDASGKATSCRIAVSSGNAALDQKTCEVLVARAHFNPALNDGQPIAGTYKNKISWRAPGAGQPSYQAIVLEFESNSEQPTCSIRARAGPADDLLSCAGLLQQVGFVAELGKRYKSVTFLVATSPGNRTPFRGEPSWGERLSFMANEQFYEKGSYPIACISIAAEGWNSGRDACDGFPGARQLTDSQKASAKRSRTEMSVYGLSR
jgi:TonB family protein